MILTMQLSCRKMTDLITWLYTIDLYTLYKEKKQQFCEIACTDLNMYYTDILSKMTCLFAIPIFDLPKNCTTYTILFKLGDSCFSKSIFR